MIFNSKENTNNQNTSFNRLKSIIEANEYPYDFREARYISEAKPMYVKCMMGHNMSLRPYELKSPYSKRPLVMKDLPICLMCIHQDIKPKEYKHRVEVFYRSNKEIETTGRYIKASIPLEYRFTRTGQLFDMIPSDMNKLLRHNPPASLLSRGLDYEKIITSRIIHGINRNRGAGNR